MTSKTIICTLCNIEKEHNEFLKGRKKCKACNIIIKSKSSKISESSKTFKIFNNIEINDKIKCIDCNEEKHKNDFYERRIQCKVCICNKLKLSRKIKAKDKIKINIKQNLDCSYCLKTKLLEDFRINRIICKFCENLIRKSKYYLNKEKEIERVRKYQNNNRLKILKLKYIYRANNKIKIKDYNNKYYLRNKHIYNYIPKKKSISKYKSSSKSKYKYKFIKNNNPNKKLKILARSNFYRFIMNKNNKFSKIVGCSLIILKQWFEYNFNDKMFWNNYGSYWHIDHIKPCSSYNFEKDEEYMECFNWKNLRPCEKRENLLKSNKIDNELINLYINKALQFKKNNVILIGLE